MKFRLNVSRRLRTGLVALVALAPVLLSACGGSEGGAANTPGALDVVAIEQASTGIAERLEAAGGVTSTAALAEAEAYADTLPIVVDAAVEDGDLAVEYQGGAIELWAAPEPFIENPPDLDQFRQRLAQLTPPAPHRADIGTQNAVLINAVHDDPGYVNARVPFERMTAVLEAAGFNVRTLYGAQATPENLAGLADRSLIVYLGHGGSVSVLSSTVTLGSPYVVQTGKEWGGWRDEDRWHNRIVKMNVHWGPLDEEGNQTGSRAFAAVSGKFWKDKYRDRSFNRALFINGACASAKDERFRQCLFDVGVAAYTGWTEDQNRGPWTAWRLIANMSSGSTLQQAVDELPLWYRRDDDAELWHGPESDITLGSTNESQPTVLITAPEPWASVSARTCVVRGRVFPVAAVDRATLTVNGESSALPFNDEGYFEQTVGLRHGDNPITVSAYGTGSDSASVTVTGAFPHRDLYSKLAWNTNLNDLDLRLRPVAGADGYRDECYFGRRRTSWGAELDVDDVNGFGPEHITAASLPAGKYLLYVHYWSPHGQTVPPTVSVTVSTNDDTARIYTLPAMRNDDDRWEVCYVNFPSGEIEPLNRYIPSGGALSRRQAEDEERAKRSADR